MRESLGMDRIETGRLLLRPFEETDGPAYRAIRLKPGVTRFLPSHTEDPAEAAHRADAASQRSVRHGNGTATAPGRSSSAPWAALSGIWGSGGCPNAARSSSCS